MSPTFKAASQGYADALQAFRSDMELLSNIEARLVHEYNNKRTYRASLETLEKIVKQIEGLDAGFSTAKQKFHAAEDAIHEGIVQSFRGICSYAEGNGRGDAGIKYLAGAIKSFDQCKGNLQRRQECYDSVIMVVEGMTNAPETKSTIIDPVKLQVYEAFESETDPEAKSSLYREHRDTIIAVENLRR
jgi:hypothetical protein